jgi:hypothetical protein
MDGICFTCNVDCGSVLNYQYHLTSKHHPDCMVFNAGSRYGCLVCKAASSNQPSYERHLSGKRHLRAAACLTRVAELGGGRVKEEVVVIEDVVAEDEVLLDLVGEDMVDEVLGSGEVVGSGEDGVLLDVAAVQEVEMELSEEMRVMVLEESEDRVLDGVLQDLIEEALVALEMAGAGMRSPVRVVVQRSVWVKDVGLSPINFDVPKTPPSRLVSVAVGSGNARMVDVEVEAAFSPQVAVFAADPPQYWISTPVRGKEVVEISSDEENLPPIRVTGVLGTALRSLTSPHKKLAVDDWSTRQYVGKFATVDLDETPPETRLQQQQQQQQAPRLIKAPDLPEVNKLIHRLKKKVRSEAKKKMLTEGKSEVDVKRIMADGNWLELKRVLFGDSDNE